MNEYLFKYKRYKRFFWKTHTVIGHRLFPDQDKMVLYIKGGGLQEIVKWSECEIKLGPDWVLSVQHNMKKETGQDVQVDVG